MMCSGWKTQRCEHSAECFYLFKRSFSLSPLPPSSPACGVWWYTHTLLTLSPLHFFPSPSCKHTHTVCRRTLTPLTVSVLYSLQQACSSSLQPADPLVKMMFSKTHTREDAQGMEGKTSGLMQSLNILKGDSRALPVVIKSHHKI